MRRPLVLLALFALLTPAAASAQTVTVHDLTVEDQTPPEQYRAALDAAIATTVAPIRACYVRELALHPGLSGDLRLRLWVSARQVIRVTPETTIGDPALETCAHDEVHRFTLPPQAPEGGAAVRFVMRFTPGATPPPSTTTAPPPSTTTPTTPPPSIMTAVPIPERAMPAFTVAFDRLRGALTAETLALVLPRTAFARCWHGGVTGSLPISVSITAAGVASARAARGSMRDATARTCITEVITQTAFPTAARNTRVRVTVALP
jgi:hypothetical protein